MEHMGYDYALIWKSIMGNFTIAQGHGIIGVTNNDLNGKKFYVSSSLVVLELIPYVKGLHMFPYFVQDYLNGLYFVSCGKPAVSSLQWKELTNIFDVWIWIALILSLIMSTISLWSYFDFKNHLPWILPLKAFLEQGNPFPETVTKSLIFRNMLALFLLIGIVLSNAYKNTNVYNMTAPRKIIPYKSLEELLIANFKIYTRMATHYPYIFETSLDINKFTDGKIKIVENGTLYILFVSEPVHLMNVFVAVLRKMLNITSFSVHEALQTNASPIHASGVLAKANFHPSIDPLLTNLYKGNTPMIIDIRIRTFKTLQQTEEKKLLEDLINCEKVALIVPQDLRAKYWKILKMQTKTSYAFTGLVAYSGIEWMFNFADGVLPPHLPKRIMSVHESGLWGRWGKLIKQRESYLNDKAGTNDVTAANINGNIIVIFFLWVAGITGAVTCFAAEYMKVVTGAANYAANLKQTLTVRNLCLKLYFIRQLMMVFTYRLRTIKKLI